jgi:hypothetical protein
MDIRTIKNNNYIKIIFKNNTYFIKKKLFNYTIMNLLNNVSIQKNDLYSVVISTHPIKVYYTPNVSVYNNEFYNCNLCFYTPYCKTFDVLSCSCELECHTQCKQIYELDVTHCINCLSQLNSKTKEYEHPHNYYHYKMVLWDRTRFFIDVYKKYNLSVPSYIGYCSDSLKYSWIITRLNCIIQDKCKSLQLIVKNCLINIKSICINELIDIVISYL